MTAINPIRYFFIIITHFNRYILGYISIDFMGQLFPGVLQHRNAIFCMPVNAPETKNLPGHKNQQQTDKYHDDHNKDWIKVQNENLIYGLRNNETC